MNMYQRVFFKRIKFGSGIGVGIPAILWFSTKQEKNYMGWSFKTGASAAPKTLSTPALLHRNSNKCALSDECGEDSFIICDNQKQFVLGIADGVGSWKRQGIDPSQFSRGLMKHLKAVVENDPECNNKDLSLKIQVHIASAIELISKSFWSMIKAFNKGLEKPFGSSTACVVSLCKDNGFVETANLGDSGFLIIRDDDIIGQSQSQQHYFNAPYQLTLTPQGHISDCSKAASVFNTQLSAGDMIILATDGLWDNLYQNQIMDVVRQCRKETELNDQDKFPQKLANMLVLKARNYSEREDYNSPFSVEAAKNGKSSHGGKPDDITVVVGIAQFINY